MATFISRLPVSGGGVRLAVKDLIDVAGVPTTAGSRALALSARPAERDAPCGLQLIGGPHAEALLLATAAIIEQAA